MFNPPKDLPTIKEPLTKNSLKIDITSPTAPPPREIQSLTINTENPQNTQKKPEPPRIMEIPKTQEIIIAPETRQRKEEITSFDEAIRNMHHQLFKNQETGIKSEGGLTQGQDHRPAIKDNQSNKLGEGYFSEIKHYLQNRNANDIADDVISKDFLTAMKDYHDHKAQGKPYYLHQHDLMDKVEAKMHDLMGKEEKWHNIKNEKTDLEHRQKQLESEIDSESQELKELFKLAKASQLLEKESKPEECFILKSGQKISSLNDLRKALTYMTDEEFSQYVTPKTNHFSEWTKNALDLPQAAEKIMQAKSKNELIQALKQPF